MGQLTPEGGNLDMEDGAETGFLNCQRQLLQTRPEVPYIMETLP